MLMFKNRSSTPVHTKCLRTGLSSKAHATQVPTIPRKEEGMKKWPNNERFPSGERSTIFEND